MMSKEKLKEYYANRRRCNNCDKWKLFEEFSLNYSFCKSCRQLLDGRKKTEPKTSTAKRRYYEKHKAVCIARSKERFVKARALLNALKDRPCLDCGRRFPPCAMDFDHRDGEEKRYVPARLKGASTETIMNEVAKCDVVCACCHRVRTALRLFIKQQAA